MAFSRSFLDDLGQRVYLNYTFQGNFEGDLDLGIAYKTKYFFQGLTNTLGVWPICDSRFARATNSNPKLRRCLSLDRGFSISLTSFARPKNLGHPPLGVCQALEKTYCITAHWFKGKEMMGITFLMGVTTLATEMRKKNEYWYYHTQTCPHCSVPYFL